MGPTVGTKATIVTLVVAAFPFVARRVETSLRELDEGVVEAAQSLSLIHICKNQISENNRVVMSVKPVAAEKMRNVTVTYRYEGSNLSLIHI